MARSFVHTGVIDTLGALAVSTFEGNHPAAMTTIIFGSAIIGAFVDNIPYTATMAPAVEELVNQTPNPTHAQGLWWAFAFGADFGGNGTAVAASANVVALGIAKRSGHPISFWQFTKPGIIVTILSTSLAWAYVWLRYFM